MATDDRDDDKVSSSMKIETTRREVLGGALALGAGLAIGGPALAEETEVDRALRERIRTVVVIYAENRSFNNLFADFPGLARPLSALSPEAFRQLDRDGTPLATLPKIWGGLVPRAQAVAGRTYEIGEDALTGLPNAPFELKDLEGRPLHPGVVTQDLWHRFYQNQMQINGGRNDQFVAWADSGALVMGRYGAETARGLSLWTLAQDFTLCDNFFMAGFGGSFLNHFMLVAGAPPVYPDAAAGPAKGKISVVDGDDPTGTRLKLAPGSPAASLDGLPKFVKDGALTPDGFAVNTMQPPYQPSGIKPAAGGDARHADPADANVLPPQTMATIGDRLSAKGVDWAWYGGAWAAALGGQNAGPVPNFQFHHQPFNYFANYAPGMPARDRHLRDGGLGDDPATNRFLADIDAGSLPPVTFYKPQGNLNMHAGYADVESGDRHIANVVDHLRKGPQWRNMLVVVTFDENGGWWDHVAPPEGDRWGPGSRIPALVLSEHGRKGTVDHTFYDTTSILRLVTRLHRLEPLDGVAARDAAFRAAGAQPPGDLTAALALA